MFALKYSGNVLPLRTALVIGRSPTCDLVFPSGRVSRRHAEFSLQFDAVVLSDLGSANGVFVNGERITAPRQLDVGDQILVGDVVMELVTLEEQFEVDEGARATRIAPPTLPGSTAYDEDGAPDSTVPGSRTQKGDAIGMLGAVADKLLAQGQVEAAERMLSGRISTLLEEAEAGVAMSEQVVSSATTYSLKLARASKKPSWVDLLFRMYASLGRTMPLDTIDQLYELVRTIPGMRVDALSAYLDALDTRRESFSPTERFAIKRLAGLRKLVASR